MTEFVNKKGNPLRIRPGDTVQIFFEHIPSVTAFSAEVLTIDDRALMGQDAGISYRRLDGKTNEPTTPDYCSVSHVRSVTHGPYKVGSRTPVNIFRDGLLEERKRDEERGRRWVGWYVFGGKRYGLAERLVLNALSCATDSLTRPFDSDKFKKLWNRAGCPGLVSSPNEEDYPSRHYTCVRWKVFKRWVLANRHRLLMSRKEMEEVGREYVRAWEEQDEEEWRRDLDREAEEDRHASSEPQEWDHGYDYDDGYYP